jgi:NAD(P)H-binding
VALVAAGHRVRVLTRSPERVAAALAPLGIGRVESTIGDVTDPGAVERALQGCDAVLHAASVFSMDARKADEMRAVNVRGTDLVRGIAQRLALDAGHYISLPDLIRALAVLSGRRIRFAIFPRWFLAASGRAADVCYVPFVGAHGGLPGVAGLAVREAGARVSRRRPRRARAP